MPECMRCALQFELLDNWLQVPFDEVVRLQPGPPIRFPFLVILTGVKNSGSVP
jgi:hypothetical protein